MAGSTPPIVDDEIVVANEKAVPLSIWNGVTKARYFNQYNYNTNLTTLQNCDVAMKDILLNHLQNITKEQYSTISGSFTAGSAYSFVAQTYDNPNNLRYGSAIVFGYALEAPLYYKMSNGAITRYEFETKNVITI